MKKILFPKLNSKYDDEKNIMSYVTVDDLREYGMIPEFLGRLPIIYSLDRLDEDMLVNILKEPKNAILKQYQKLLELDEVKLEFTDDALRSIARKAMEKDTGARALRSIIEDFMLDIMYEIPKDSNIGSVTITEDVVELQTVAAFTGVSEEDAKNVIIAYEPVWAIGTGKTATADQAEEVCAFIRATIAKLYNQAAADAVTIQYGGSMNDGNADELLSKTNVDGGLIGGASLVAEKFAAIVKAASK